MRLKRHLLAATVGGAVVWFNHPTEGERRREAARVIMGRARSSVDDALVRTMGRARSRPGAVAPATLLDVVEYARRDGAETQFTVAPETRLHCSSCESEVEPAAVAREWMHRLEGASDPDELLSVSMIACPACAARGLLVLPYGPAADPLESEVARRLPNPTHTAMSSVVA